MERSIVLALALCAAMCVCAQDASDAMPLRRTLNIAGAELEKAEKVKRAEVILYYVGGLVTFIGFDKDNDYIKLAVGTMIVSGVICTHIAIGHRSTAARLMREL